MRKEIIEIEGNNQGFKWFDSEKEFERIIAIGDVHGCADGVKFLIDNLKPTPKDQVIFLGDYIDRGPDSPGTIEFLLKLKEQVPCFFLRGNHDAMFLSFFGIGGNNGLYFSHHQNGGDTTLAQYGASTTEIAYSLKRKGTFKPNSTVKLIESKIPEEHTEFLLNTKMFLEMDNFFFSHAGFNVYSNKPYDQQSEEEYTWTREQFLGKPHKKLLDKIVVHGHTINFDTFTPTWDMELMKINLDSGSFYSGNISSLTITPADYTKCYMSVSNFKEKYFQNAGSKA